MLRPEHRQWPSQVIPIAQTKVSGPTLRTMRRHTELYPEEGQNLIYVFPSASQAALCRMD